MRHSGGQERGGRDGSTRQERLNAVIAAAARPAPGTRETLLAALADPDRRVRITAVMGLVACDRDLASADAIISALAEGADQDARATEELVRLGVGAGTFGYLRLTPRLLPHLETVARAGESWRVRRRARFYLRELS